MVPMRRRLLESSVDKSLATASANLGSYQMLHPQISYFGSESKRQKGDDTIYLRLEANFVRSSVAPIPEHWVGLTWIEAPADCSIPGVLCILTGAEQRKTIEEPHFERDHVSTPSSQARLVVIRTSIQIEASALLLVQA